MSVSPTLQAQSDETDLFGTGLGQSGLFTVFAVSVALFLLWDGPLWTAAQGRSHFGRIAVSYAVVIPMVMGALVAQGHWRWDRGATAVALIWSAKLLVTSSLYYVLASPTATSYAPIRPWEAMGTTSASQPPRAAYSASPSTFKGRDITGRVTAAGQPVAGAVVMVESPAAGRVLGPPRDVAWSVRKGHHDAPVRLLFVGDRVTIVSRDLGLHTLRMAHNGRAVCNIPLVPGAAPRSVEVPGPGLLALSCESHGGEGAPLVVVDHPYATVTDADGRFTLQAVPTSSRELVTVGPTQTPSRSTVSATPDTTCTVAIDLAAARATHGGNE